MVPLEPNSSGSRIDQGTRFLVLNDGGIKFHGDTEQLVHSDDPWIKEYLA